MQLNGGMQGHRQSDRVFSLCVRYIEDEGARQKSLANRLLGASCTAVNRCPVFKVTTVACKDLVCDFGIRGNFWFRTLGKHSISNFC